MFTLPIKKQQLNKNIFFKIFKKYHFIRKISLIFLKNMGENEEFKHSKTKTTNF